MIVLPGRLTVGRHPLEVVILGSNPSPAANKDKIERLTDPKSYGRMGDIKMEQTKKFIVVIIVLALLGGIGYVALKNVPSSDEGLAARVNGEEVKKALLEKRFDQIKASYEAQGTPLADQDVTTIRQQLLDGLISETLLLQYAREQGISANEEMIENEYQQIVLQFPKEEDFQNMLTTQGMNIQELRQEISRQLIFQQIADRKATEANIVIPEGEMRQTYDETVASGVEVPPFEEVRGEIEEFLKQQKIGQLMDELVGQLRAQASIEILS